MKKATEKLQNGFVKTKLCLAAACLIGYAVLVALSGANPFTALYVAAAVLAFVYLPGRLLAQLLRLDGALPAAKASMGILLGTGFFTVIYCFGQRLHCLSWLRWIPLIMGLGYAIWWLYQNRKRRFFASPIGGHTAAMLLLWAALVLLFAFQISVKNAHPAAVGSICPNNDVLWNVGNAESFALGFPPQDIRFSMVRLAYHYLTEMFAGALALVCGVSAYNMIVFYIAPCVLGALVIVLWQLGLVLFKQNKSKALLGVFCMFLFNCVSGVFALTNGAGLFFNTNLYHLVTNVNSQATAVIFGGIFLMLFTHLAGAGFKRPWTEIAVFLASYFLLCFGKGPAAAIIMCSFVITMLFILARKPAYGKALVCLAGVVAVFLCVYMLVFSSGANNSVHFGNKTLEQSLFGVYLTAMPNKVLTVLLSVLFAVINTVCMIPLQAFLTGHALCRDVRNICKLPAEKLILYGITAGGFLAYYLFWHPSYSQLYFALIAVFAAGLLAVDEIDRLKGKPARTAALVLGAAGVLTSAVLAVNFAGSGMRQLLRNKDVIPKYPYVVTVSAADEDAMRWLKANTPDNALCVTNRINTSGVYDGDMMHGNGISNAYSAFSGRQFYMEGYTYAVTNMGISEAVLGEKQQTVAALFSADTTPQQAQQLCEKYGIQYVVYSSAVMGSDAAFINFEKVFENEGVRIYCAP